MIKDQINLEWKLFKIDLISFEAYMRAKYPNYAGHSAHATLDLIFSQKLSEIEKQEIRTYYDSLVEADEASKLSLGSRQPFQLKTLKLKEITNGMILKDKLLYTSIEKKLDAGIELSNADWDTLL